MRTGGGAVQQALTAEAASTVKQAVALARQRGHAQVTPLHVANSMLAASTGLFRQACLKSHSHPLQCRALELCFNVALNRLPAASSSPMLSPHSFQHPAISNALVAAFKRAQAHQRRGAIENNDQQQPQPVLAVEIELDQLIISILDDPSVSRVMREAGFSSTKVKTNVEQAISLQISSQLTPPSSNHEPSFTSASDHDHQTVNNDQDVIRLIESLMNMRRRKSIVIVGECIESLESKVKCVMEKIDKGDVAEALREVKFISFPLFTLVNLRREEVEEKIGELKCLVRSLLAKGVVLYLGDLKWIVDYRANNNGEQKRSYYCPVEHMIMEVGRFVYGFGEKGNFRVMGIATFQTYMRCRNGHNSPESLWGLSPVTMPAGSLGLSLIPHSDYQANSKNEKDENKHSQLLLDKGDEKQLRCCADCSARLEAEARNLQIMVTCDSESTLSSLPSWLKDKSKRSNNNHQSCATVLKELSEKWNPICNAFHKQSSKSLERALTVPSTSSSSPSSSNSCFSYDQQFHDLQLHFDPPKQSWRDHDHQFSITAPYNIACETSLRMCIPDHTDPTQAFSINSTSSSETMEMDYLQKFKEFNAVNLNILCDALEKKVPWQKEIIPEIAGTILQCRSSMLRRKDKPINGEVKQETWLFFHGQDSQAKEEIARELARVVFGSYSNLVSISLISSFFSTRSDSSSEDLRNKRFRDEKSCSYMERFADAVCVNPHRVFFMEDVEQADYCSQKSIKRAIETGKINNSCGEEVSLSDAIIIFSCDSFNYSRSKACSPSSVKQKLDGSEEEEACTVSLDLNLYFSGESVEDHLSEDMGLLENVDKRVVFRIVGE